MSKKKSVLVEGKIILEKENTKKKEKANNSNLCCLSKGQNLKSWMVLFGLVF
jgi:hypothetical protein